MYISHSLNRCCGKSKIKLKIQSNPLRFNGYWVNDKVIKACQYRDNLFMQWLKDTNDIIVKQKYIKPRNFANKTTKYNAIEYKNLQM